MPTVLRQVYGANDGVNTADYGRIEMGRFLKWTDYPVYRFRRISSIGGMIRRSLSGARLSMKETLLFDIQEDYAQEHPIQNEELEAHCAAEMKKCMELYDAPAEQYERMGI